MSMQPRTLRGTNMLDLATLPRANVARTTVQHDYILIDSSSSMSTKWMESLAAVDAYIAGVQAAGISSNVILHMFYSQAPDYIHSQGPIGQWKPLCSAPPLPQGMTPLYDAITLMGLRLRQIDPARCSVLIVTDGEDDGGPSSPKLPQARAILDWMRAKGWQVTFIGCDFSNSEQAKLLGSARDSAIGVQKRLLTDAASALARKRANYGLYGTPMHFTDDEQQQFGGYLAHSAPAA
jgi:hypothetical protein